MTTSKPPYPTQIPENPGNICFIEDCGNYPNATETVDQYGGSNGYVPEANLEQLCVLWNSSCAGNKHDARNDFFGNDTAGTLRGNDCFQNQPTDPKQRNNLEGCYEIESPERLLRFGQVKSWMRSPQCLNNATKWSASQPGLAGLATVLPHGDSGAGSCCAKCDISVRNVDIYYWPEPDVDTSCLNIIGNNSKSLDHGATTTSQEYAYIGRSSSTVSYFTYWGCTGQDSSITTTAYITQINSIKFKASAYNPWSSPPCPEEKTQPIASKASDAARGEHAPIRARAQSLIIRPTITQNQEPVSTVVLDNFTFTSPSIYANFHNVVGDDGCGKPVYVPSTMLTFLPGELSTIAGPLTDCNIDYCSFSTKAYNFRDLPCPPRSVMEENWYKPQPGEPYRPLIAMPKQILKMRPYFSRCVDNFFTGFDPPRTLAPAAALAPSTTTTNPVAFTTAPTPSPTPDIGVKKTANGGPPIITPSEIPVGQPRKQDIQASHPKHQISDPGKESHNLAPPVNYPAQPDPKSEEIKGDSQQGGKANTIVGEAKNPTSPFIPVPSVAAGIAKPASDQNTDPASNDVSPPLGNVDPVDVGPTDSHSQVQPGDPQHIGNPAKTVEDTGGNNPSEVHQLPGIVVDPENYIPQESSPADETEAELRNEDPTKPSQSSKAIEDPSNDDLSSNKVPGKSDPADEITGESRTGDPLSTEPSITDMQDSGTETTNESDTAHDTKEDPGKGYLSRPRPSAEVMNGDTENNPSNSDQVVGGPGNEVLDELNIADTIGDSGKEIADKLNSSFETLAETGKESSSDLDSSAVYPESMSLSAVDRLLDITKDPGTAYADELDPSSGKDASSKTNPSVKIPAEESFGDLESLFETPKLPAQTDPSKSDASTETSLDPDDSEDPAQSINHDKSDDLPQQNDETDSVDPFHISPNHLHRIKAALSFSAQAARLHPEPTPKRYGASNHHDPPHQSSILNNHTTITATPIVTSDTFRTVNGTLNTPSAAANVSVRSATSSPSNAGITAESGVNFRSAARTGSSGGKHHKNVASDVGAMSSRAWIGLGMLMVLGM